MSYLRSKELICRLQTLSLVKVKILSFGKELKPISKKKAHAVSLNMAHIVHVSLILQTTTVTVYLTDSALEENKLIRGNTMAYKVQCKRISPYIESVSDDIPVR